MKHRHFQLIFLLLLFTLSILWTTELTAASPPERDPDTVPAFPGDGWNLSLIGHWSDGPGMAVAVRGDTVFAGSGATLLVLHMPALSLPTEIGRLTMPSVPRGIDLAGDYAFVADYQAGLQIVDISDAGNPSVIGVYETGYAYDIEVVGDYAYLADMDRGLVIIDVSDPANPAEVGQLDTMGAVRGVNVEGNNAYIASVNDGFFIVDVSDVTTPAVLGSYDTPGNAQNVDVVGTLAYVTDYQQGLRVIDISTPATPAEIGFVTGMGEARCVRIVGTYAYVGCSAFNIVDISTPSSPVVVGFHYPGGGPSNDVWTDGTTAFVAQDHAGIVRYDVTVPATPALQSQWDTPGYTSAVAVDGNYAYLTDYDDGFFVLDISVPSTPNAVGNYSPGESATDITIVADTAYTTWGDGLRIIDVTNPAAPVEIGYYGTGYYEEICVDGNTAYIANKASGFRIIDITDPAAPSEIGHYQSPGYVFGVDYQAGYAYLADATQGLRIVDVSAPATPVEAGSYVPAGGWAYAVVVDGDYAYLGDTSYGLIVIDVSVPTAPVEVGNIRPSSSLFDLAKSGEYVFLGHSEQGVSAVFVDDKTNPVLVGRFDTGDDTERLFAVGNSVYVANRDAGLYILEFDPPPTLTTIAMFDAIGSDRSVELVWDIQSDDDVLGFRVYRTPEGSSDPEIVNAGGLISPGVRRFIDTTGRRGESYNYVLAVVLADGSEVRSVPLNACACGLSVIMHQSYPNPFNPVTTISFEIPAATRVNLSVFDTRGVLVRTLIDGSLERGRKSLDWDGRDNRGNPVGSGVYFCRLEAGKRVFTQKLTLLK